MPDQISQLKQAGFSDQEIGDWATGARSRLSQAGFSDDEVSSYLGGTPPMSAKPPQAFLDRLMQGTGLASLWSHLESGQKKADAASYVAGPDVFLRGATQAFDTSAPHIFSEEFEKNLRDAGVIADPATGRAGPLRFANEALLRSIGVYGDLISRLGSAAVGGLAETIGETVKRLGGTETTGEAAKRETQNLANAMMVDTMARGVHVSGIGREPGTGRLVDLPLGGAARPEDFPAAAKVMVGNEASPEFQAKLQRLYEEKGLLPAEVAHDAASDVTVTQALASTGTDLPERYTGTVEPTEEIPREGAAEVPQPGRTGPRGEVGTAIEATRPAAPAPPVEAKPEPLPWTGPTPPDPLGLQQRGELSGARAEEIRDQLRTHTRAEEDRIFGEDADRWRKLQRQSNAAWDRADDAKAHEYDRQIAEIESKVDPRELDRLSGVGAPPGIDPDSWHELASDLRAVEESHDDAVSVLASKVRRLPDDLSRLTEGDRETLAVLGHAMDMESQRGGDPIQLLRDAVEERVRRYGGGRDAEELAADYVRRLRGLMEAPPPEPLALPPPEAVPPPAPAGVAALPEAIPSVIPNGIESIRPSDLAVDANRFQFKAGTDEAGVSDRLRDVTNWDPVKAGLSLVWEDENGQRFIVDGHQRLALAKRIAETDPAQDPRLNAIVLREADGVSDTEARVIAAAKNVAEGTGTAVDAAKILRDRPDLIKELPPRSELVRQARGLAELGDEPFGMIVNEVVPPAYGAIVGRLAPADAKLQGALIDLLNKTQPANMTQAEAIVRQGIAAGTRTETQATLFGDQDVVSSLYADRARVLDGALQQLRHDRLVFAAIVRNEDVINAVGNRLETTANANRAAADAQAIQILQILANRRGPLSDALNDAARRAAAGQRAAAVREFVDAIRRQAESGDLLRAADGLERGRADAGREDAAQLVDPAALPAAAGDDASANAEAARVIDDAKTQEAAPELKFGPETGAIQWGPAPPKTPLETARDAILDKVSVGERPSGRTLRGTLDGLIKDWVDQFFPVSEITPRGRPTAINPYRLARMMAGLGDRITYTLRRSTLDFATLQPNGIGLEQVLAPVKGDLQGFRAFAVAAHALEMEAEGLTSGIDTGAARTYLRETVGKYGPVLEQLVGYQNRVAAYMRDAGVISRDAYDAMTQRWQLYIPFNRVMGDGDGFFGVGSSLQASDPLHRLRGSMRDIVDPLENVIRNTATYMTMAEKNVATASLRDLLAGGGQIGARPGAPIALLPHVADPALDAALDQWLTAHGVPPPPPGVMNFFRAAGAQPLERGEIAVFDNGVRHVYKVDPELAESWKGLDRYSAGMLEKILAPLSRTLRAGAVLSPEFGLRHPYRDFFYAAITGQFTPLDMARGYAGMVAHYLDERLGIGGRLSDQYWNWMKSGGGNNSMVALDRDFLQEDLAKLTQQTGLMTRTWNLVVDPNATWLDRAGAIAGLPFKAGSRYVLRPFQVFTSIAENATHLGKYMQVEREMMRAQPGVPLTREQILEAGWQSRDIAVDASQIGAKMRALNMISAFSNIVVRDSARWMRAFREDPLSTSIKVMGYITIPQMLLYLAQRNDPRYDEIPAWERILTVPILTDKWEDVGPAGQFGPPDPSSNYRVQGDRLQVNNGTIWRLPQPWSLGVIFGAGPVAVLRAFEQHSGRPLGDWLRGLADVSLLRFTPNAVVPIAEQFANRSLFTDRTIIPSQLEKQLPEYQYTPYTTEAAKKLGQIIGAFPGMRATATDPGALGGGVARALTNPALLENYIRGWSGGLGVYALQLADFALRKDGILPDPPRPASTLADIPFVKAFVIRYPAASAQSIQDFHDAYAFNKRYYDTWQAQAKAGDADAARRVANIGGPMMFVQFDQIEKTLTEHQQLIQNIYKNPEMKSEEKRQLIDQTYYSMIQIAHAGTAMMRQADAVLSGVH